MRPSPRLPRPSPGHSHDGPTKWSGARGGVLRPGDRLSWLRGPRDWSRPGDGRADRCALGGPGGADPVAQAPLGLPRGGLVRRTGPRRLRSFASTLNYGLQFDVDQHFTLISVDVYPTAGGSLQISLTDSSGNTLDSVNLNVSAGGPVTVPLNFDLQPGTGYRLLQTSNPSLSLIRDTSGNNFPYQIGTGGMYGTITNGTYGTSTSNTTTYYYFFNWTIGDGVVLCESPREEIVATVTQSGDKLVGALNYTDSDNTANFGGSFSGSPG